ncbi:hypothetical protein Emag_006982 [Eimeria magna]
MAIDDNKDVVVAPAGGLQGPKKVDGDEFEKGPYGRGAPQLRNTEMAAVIAKVMRFDGATAENGWEDDAREGVTYANIQKVMEHTELQRRVPQGEVVDSGGQKNVAPPMDNLG